MADLKFRNQVRYLQNKYKSKLSRKDLMCIYLSTKLVSDVVYLLFLILDRSNLQRK